MRHDWDGDRCIRCGLKRGRRIPQLLMRYWYPGESRRRFTAPKCRLRALPEIPGESFGAGR